MLRFSLMSLMAHVFLLWATPVSAQVYAFQVNDHIAVADLADPQAPVRKLAEGNDPAISPDGKEVAFTKSDEQGNRRIAIVDVATGKVRLVAGIPGQNEFMPAWSVDGKRLCFSHFGNSDWEFAQVDPAEGTFQILLKEGGRSAGAYGVFQNGNGWLCHDLDSFFILKTGGIREVPNSTDVLGLSMPSRIDVAPDCKRALFESFIEEDMGPEDEGPPSAIFLIDLATGERTRISPKGLNSMYPSWIPGTEEFLFAGFDVKTMEDTIYRMKAAPGETPVLVRKKASWPSVAKGSGNSR